MMIPLCHIAILLWNGIVVVVEGNESHCSAVPIIDVSSLVSTTSRSGSADRDDRERAIREIAKAAREVGFFHVVNHGWSKAKREKTFASARELFALNQEEKLSVRVSRERPGFTRGFVTIGGESGSDLNECKEAFSYGYDWKPYTETRTPNDLEGENVWPASTSFRGRTVMDEFFKDMVAVSDVVVRGLSLALGFDEHYLSQFCQHGDRISLMRLFHYLPYDHPSVRYKFGESEDKIGSSPHTDWGFLTLVVQENNQSGAGLECLVDDEWLPVDPVEDSIVVNCGDFISLLSRGRIKSPLHRVVNGVQDRYSMVFFYCTYSLPPPTLHTLDERMPDISPTPNADPDFESQIPIMEIEEESSSTQHLSLLQDQHVHGGNNAEVDVSVPFGRYISQKWASVARDGAG